MTQQITKALWVQLKRTYWLLKFSSFCTDCSRHWVLLSFLFLYFINLVAFHWVSMSFPVIFHIILKKKLLQILLSFLPDPLSTQVYQSLFILTDRISLHMFVDMCMCLCNYPRWVLSFALQSYDLQGQNPWSALFLFIFFLEEACFAFCVIMAKVWSLLRGEI